MDKTKSLPPRGNKITVRDGNQENALTELYDKSEFAEENEDMAPEKDISEKDATPKSEDEDIKAFLDDMPDETEEEIPAKKKSTTHKKKSKKDKKVGKTIGKIFAIILLIAILTFIVLIFFMPNTITNVIGGNKRDAIEPDQIFYSPLTGLEVTDQKLTTAATTCVMIENSTDARPQAGLQDAGVVYEMLAEGGISRFMAIFQENRSNHIGPIRSLRLSYAEFSRPYHCALVHFGGASNALNAVAKDTTGYRDFNLLTASTAFYSRASQRTNGTRIYAPHNVFSSIDKLQNTNNLFVSRGWSTSNFTGFTRVKPDTARPDVEQNATAITIKLSNNNSYTPVYAYDAKTNTYLRSHKSGGAHYNLLKNGSKVQLAPTVVVAMKVTPVSRGSTGYYDYKTTGGGEAYIFQNGTVIKGKWQRNSLDEELKFVDETGSVIELNRGQVWITAYPSNTGSVSYQ